MKRKKVSKAQLEQLARARVAKAAKTGKVLTAGVEPPIVRLATDPDIPSRRGGGLSVTDVIKLVDVCAERRVISLRYAGLELSFEQSPHVHKDAPQTSGLKDGPELPKPRASGGGRLREEIHAIDSEIEQLKILDPEAYEDLQMSEDGIDAGDGD